MKNKSAITNDQIVDEIMSRRSRAQILEINYTNAHEKNIKIKCENNHIFLLCRNNFLKNGTWCPHCAPNKKKTKREVIKAINKKHLGCKILDFEYKNYNTKNIPIICKNGHKNLISWSDAKRKKVWCKECLKNKLYTKERVIKEIKKLHPKSFVYDNFEYKNGNIKNIKIKCEKNHLFTSRWNDIKKGHWCPKCKVSLRLAQQEISNFLLANNISFKEDDRTLIYPKEVDFYLPDYGVAIEYCGIHWHSNRFKELNYHKNKFLMCKNKKIKLLTIYEDEWLENKNDCIDRIKLFINKDYISDFNIIEKNNILLITNKNKTLEKIKIRKYKNKIIFLFNVFKFKININKVVDFLKNKYYNKTIVAIIRNENFFFDIKQVKNIKDIIITKPSYKIVKNNRTIKAKTKNINVKKIYDCGKTLIYFS